MVGVDTGLTHLAAALGARTVGIYCGSDPALTGLYGAARATQRRRARARRRTVAEVLRALRVRVALHAGRCASRCRSRSLRLWWRGRREPRLPRVARRALRPLRQRPAGARSSGSTRVSVGEARAAAPLVRALGERVPDHRHPHRPAPPPPAARRSSRSTANRCSRLPAVRLPGAVQRFLEYFRPRLGILMETEVWPNLLAGCAAHGVPMLLANARLSAEVGARLSRAGARWRGRRSPPRARCARRARPTPSACARSARATWR